MGYIKAEKFSYSKLNTYESCSFKYYLVYKQGHYINAESIAIDLGVLLHACEQQIAEYLKLNKPVDYKKLKNDFININVQGTSKDNHNLLGVKYLQEKYPEEFFKVDDRGISYATKVQEYLEHGIYRLENYIKSHPGYVILDTEKFFSITFKDKVLSGFIDRVIYDTYNHKYIIEDIKTKDKLFKNTELEVPLQFVVYAHALHESMEIPYEDITCYYDLPFCDAKQLAGSPNYINKGLKKIEEILQGAANNEFAPNPTPLCAWCQFSPTNPNQPEEGKNLCCYYSLWTREKKIYNCAHEWTGLDEYPTVLEKEINKRSKKEKKE